MGLGFRSLGFRAVGLGESLGIRAYRSWGGVQASAERAYVDFGFRA